MGWFLILVLLWGLLFLMCTIRWVCGRVNVGGSVTAGLGIYDTMQYVLPPVATWCVGQAASMASLLLTAGSPGMRHSLPNSRIMIHQPSGHAAVNSLRFSVLGFGQCLWHRHHLLSMLLGIIFLLTLIAFNSKTVPPKRRTLIGSYTWLQNVL